jgi:predicted nucleotidyltransferase
MRRLVEAYRPEYIYLFGSVARGDAGRDSDYDIMVVVPDEAPREGRTAFNLAREVMDAILGRSPLEVRPL